MRKITFLLFLLNITICFSQTDIDNVQLKKINASRTFAKNYLKGNKIPGMSISISKNGKLIWSEGFGFSNIKTKAKVSPSETQFRIASISKPITASALAKLVDARQLDFDASIYTYIPDFPKKKYDFTIRQVGGHIAGIRHYKGKEFLLNTKMTITQGLNIFSKDTLLFKPGSSYKYSTYGWNLLSVVVQNASMTEFNKYIKEVIFNPLKMLQTTVDVSDSIMPNRTQFYRKTKENKIILGPKVSNEYKVAGGGFLSTSEDLIRFGNEIIAPKILSKQVVLELVKPQHLDSGKSTFYGIGFSIGSTKNGTPKYSHSGGGIGASTLLVMYPKEKIVICILTNVSQAPIRSIGNTLESIFID